MLGDNVYLSLSQVSMCMYSKRYKQQQMKLVHGRRHFVMFT